MYRFVKRIGSVRLMLPMRSLGAHHSMFVLFHLEHVYEVSAYHAL